MWLLISGLIIIALATATLFIVSNPQRSAEADATGTQQLAETINSWCATTVINECFEPGCTAPPMSFGECRFYFLYDQDQRATRQALSTPSP